MLVDTVPLQFQALSCQREGDIATPETTSLAHWLRHASMAAGDIHSTPARLQGLGYLTPKQHVKESPANRQSATLIM